MADSKTISAFMRSVVPLGGRGKARLPAAKDKDVIPSSSAVGKKAGSSGALPTELLEKDAKRVYFDFEDTVSSSDGFFVMVVQAVAETEFVTPDNHVIKVLYQPGENTAEEAAEEGG